MEILVQMPSRQGKRKGKKDYMNHLANYGESRCPGRRPGAWQNRWGGAQEKFKEIRDFNNFDHQGLQLDAELFLTYCKPWEQKQMRKETHISHSDCFSFLKFRNRKEMKPSWGSLPQIGLRVPPRLPFWTPGGGRYIQPPSLGLSIEHEKEPILAYCLDPFLNKLFLLLTKDNSQLCSFQKSK